MHIQVIDRVSKQIETEQIYGHRALSLLYGDSLSSRLFSLLFLPLIAYAPLFSKLYGLLQKTKRSAKKIAPFIQTYNVDTSEFAPTTFASFNDFFIRKLKPSARPVDQDPSILTFPADGRYLFFQNLKTTSTFYVKGQSFDLPAFLQDPVLANRYQDGAMLIARLCPTDYHRFHFPCDGIPEKSRPIPGPLFSVNPLALRKRLSILSQNKRELTEIETDHFGTLLFIEVGATCVGTIRQTYTPDKRVKKGDEKGYFEFGGSCLVLLFEKDRVVFDTDLLENTQRGLETKANFGGAMGRVNR